MDFDSNFDKHDDLELMDMSLPLDEIMSKVKASLSLC